MRRDSLHLFPLISIFLLFSPLCYGQAWSGVLAPARATNWTQAGLPGDVPPDSAWTQAGSTINACGSSGSPVSPSACGITPALAACGTNHYVQLGNGDFYLTGSINLPSNCVLRGGGASQTRLHAVSSGSYNCNGQWGLHLYHREQYLRSTAIVACGLVRPEPAWAAFKPKIPPTGREDIRKARLRSPLDNVTGIVVNVTPIVVDQCDIGFGGNTSNFACGAPARRKRRGDHSGKRRRRRVGICWQRYRDRFLRPGRFRNEFRLWYRDVQSDLRERWSSYWIFDHERWDSATPIRKSEVPVVRKPPAVAGAVSP